MIKLTAVIATIIILVGCSGWPIADIKYTLVERYNRPFCDVNKTNINDGKMCWAAGVSNNRYCG